MFSLRKLSMILSATILSLGLQACANPEDIIVNSAMEGMQRAAGDHVEKAVYGAFAPEEPAPSPNRGRQWNQYMVTHAQTVFAHSFSVGGYWISRADFQPGEWAEYEIDQSGNDQSVAVEKAFLKRTEEGNEWWRVTWSVDDDQTWVYESLIDRDRGELLRLRGQDQEGNVKEIPVEKGTRVYRQPRDLTEQSIEGATVGTSTVRTRAGSFDADEVRYGAVGAQGDVAFWLNDDVPGGVVKYRISNNQDAQWTSTLVDYGSNATTRLESY